MNNKLRLFKNLRSPSSSYSLLVNDLRQRRSALTYSRKAAVLYRIHVRFDKCVCRGIGNSDSIHRIASLLQTNAYRYR
jgi:hypothetical protein